MADEQLKYITFDSFAGGISGNIRDKRKGYYQDVVGIDMDKYAATGVITPYKELTAPNGVRSNLTSVTSSGTTATATSTAEHGLTTGDSVTISGANEAAYNGTFTATVSSATVFTYTMLSDPVDVATGTIIAEYSTLRNVRGFALTNNDTMYALATAWDGDAQLWIKQSISTTPTSYGHAFSSTNDAHPNGGLAWHVWASGADYLYYMTVSGSTVTLRSLGDLDTVTEASVGTMDGLDGTDDRIDFERYNGELYITNGRYISKVDNTGAFTQHAFTLPTGMTAVSIAVRQDLLYILCKFDQVGLTQSRIITWNFTSTSQPVDVIQVASSGAQWIVNHNENLRILCRPKSQFIKLFEMPGNVPTLTHEKGGNYAYYTEVSNYPVSSVNTVFVVNDTLYFGYAQDLLSLKVLDGVPVLTDRKAFDDTDRYINAATAYQENFYVATSLNTGVRSKMYESLSSTTTYETIDFTTPIFDISNKAQLKDLERIMVNGFIDTESDIIVYIYDASDNLLCYVTLESDEAEDGLGLFWDRLLAVSSTVTLVQNLTSREFYLEITLDTENGESPAQFVSADLFVREHQLL